MTNEERAEQLDVLIGTFAKMNNIEGEDDLTQASDMFCNLLHWIAKRTDGRQALKAAVRGVGHFVAEYTAEATGGDEELADFDAFVRLEATCDGSEWFVATGGALEGQGPW